MFYNTVINLWKSSWSLLLHSLKYVIYIYLIYLPSHTWDFFVKAQQFLTAAWLTICCHVDASFATPPTPVTRAPSARLPRLHAEEATPLRLAAWRSTATSTAIAHKFCMQSANVHRVVVVVLLLLHHHPTTPQPSPIRCQTVKNRLHTRLTDAALAAATGIVSVPLLSQRKPAFACHPFPHSTLLRWRPHHPPSPNEVIMCECVFSVVRFEAICQRL